MLGVAAKDKDEPVDAQMVWAGLGPARQAGVCVQFPHVVLQEDQRLVEAESSSPVCQLSITLVLGERGQDQGQSQSHGPEPEPNPKPRAKAQPRTASVWNRGVQGWCYCLRAAVARVLQHGWQNVLVLVSFVSRIPLIASWLYEAPRAEHRV